MNKDLLTENLIMREANEERDCEAFLSMLREDGDLGDYTLMQITSEDDVSYFFTPLFVSQKDEDFVVEEKNDREYYKWFYSRLYNIRYALFERGAPSELLGLVSLSKRKSKSYVDAYVKKSQRRRGFASQATAKLVEEAFAGNLVWRNGWGKLESFSQPNALNSPGLIFVTAFFENNAARKALEKIGFVISSEAEAKLDLGNPLYNTGGEPFNGIYLSSDGKKIVEYVSIKKNF